MLDSATPLRSLKGDQATTVRFVNLAPLSVQVLWLDYNGQPQPYAHLARGGSFVQGTYATHPWVVKEAHSGALLAQTVATAEPQTLVIDALSLRSQDAHLGPVTVQFKNSTHLAVDLYWIDYEGQEKLYATLQPGTYLQQGTYPSHPWRVRTHEGQLELALFIPDEQGQQVCEVENTLIGFENHTFLTCDVFRISPDGQEQMVLSLQPQESALAENYSAQPWIVRDQCSGVKLSRGRPSTKPLTVRVRDRYLRSRESNMPVKVTFSNRNAFPVELYWIDYQGNPQLYRSLQPGESFVQPTYAGHPWRALERYSREQVAFYVPNADSEQGYTIQLRSTRGEQATAVQFANHSGLTADIYWIGYDGSEKHYHTLPPHAVYTQSTYVTHPWVARDRHSGTVLAATVAVRQQEVVRLSDETLRSLDGGPAVNVLFENATSFPVDVYWLDAQGKPQHYRTLGPADSYSQPTYRDHPWRIVKKATGEEIASFIPNGDKDQTCEIKIASLRGDIPAEIEFSNRTALTADLYWVDYQGNEVLYATLQPHDHRLQPTYVTHPWVVKDHYSQEVLAVAVGKKKRQTVRVTTQHLRSLSSDHPVTVTFTNRTPFKVDVSWINFEGKDQLYRTLQPSESFQQSTYASHPWRATAEGFQATIGLFIPTRAPQQTFEIQNSLIRTQERPGGVLLEGEVALYEHTNFQGTVWILNADLSNFLLVQGMNDRFSSVRVGPNTGVTLFQHVGFQGQATDLYMDNPDLTRTAVGNDAVSSLQVWEVVSPQSLGVSSRSTLTEDYRLNAQGQMEKFANYRTILSVPHTVRALDIWATAETTIEVAGQEYTIDPERPARLLPNRISKVLINIQASDLSVPGLKVRTNNMKQHERFLVFPDVDLHTKLAGLPDGALYDSRDRLAIDQKFDKTACDHVQQSIQNMARTVQYTYQPQPFGVHHDRQITAGNMEHAHWSLDFGGEGPAYRPLSANEVRTLTAGARRLEDPLAQGFWDDVGGFFEKAGQVIVHTAENIGEDIVETGKHIVGDVVETAENVGKHVVQTVEKVGEDLVHGDVVDAASDLGQGTLSVGQDLSSGALHVGGDLIQGGLQVLGDVAKGAANLVVVTLKFADEAVQFVLSHTGVVGQFISKILEKIGSAAQKLIHWVMDQLGWEDILHAHDVLVESFNNGIDRLKQWPEQLKQEADAFFTSLEDKISDDIDGALKKMGTYDRLKHDAQGEQHSDAVEKVEWLLSKLVEHETGNPISMVNPLVAASGGGPISEFMQVAEGALGKDNANLKAILDEAMTYILAVFNDPHPTPALALSAILEVVKLTAVAGLKIVNTIADALLDLIIYILDHFKEVMNQKWEVPFLSDFYSFLTDGRDLSLVSFTSLLVAIPTTLISKAAQGVAPFRTSGALALSLEAPEQRILDWGRTYGAMHIIMTPIAIVADGYQLVDTFGNSVLGNKKSGSTEPASVDKFSSAINYVSLGLGFIAQLAGCPIGYPDFNNPDFFSKNITVKAPNYWAHVVWDYQWAGWGIALLASGGITGSELAKVKEGAVAIMGDILKGFTTAWGIAHMALMVVLDLSDHAKADRITALGEADWDRDAKDPTRESLKTVLAEMYRGDHPNEWIENLKREIDSASEEELKKYIDEVDGYRNYEYWVHDGHIPQKTFGNIMDTFPEIGQLGAMPHIAEATFGLSLLGTAAFDLLGNLSEGITYVVRTNQYALL